MQICIVGWYLEEKLFEQLAKLPKEFDIHLVTYWERYYVIESRIKQMLKIASEVKSWRIPVSGLEFGHYDYFLKNIWDNESNILLMHDDIRIHDLKFFDQLKAYTKDQAYIFRNPQQSKNNQHFHGRGIYLSARCARHLLDTVCICKQSHDYPDIHNNKFCSFECAEKYKKEFGARYDIKFTKMELRDDRVMKREERCTYCKMITTGEMVYTILRGTGPHKGIWFDYYNDGRHARGKPPLGLRHYNDGIYHFALNLKRVRSNPELDFDVDNQFYSEDFEHAKRGTYEK